MIVALLNQKGGVGKTTLVLGLAAAAADTGMRVLVVDMDPQANATSALEPATFHPGPDLSVSDVLSAARPGGASQALYPTSWPGIDVLPAELALAHRQGEAVTAGELRLRRSLQGATDAYGLVLVDCPPALGSLSVNALVAADLAVIVTEPALASVEGVVGVLRTADAIEPMNPTLQIAGIILNRTRGTRESALRTTELEAAFGETGTVRPGLLWHPHVPDAAVLAEAYGAHQAVQRLGGDRARDVSARLGVLAAQLLPVAA